jgi:hypothetical protein
MSEMKVGERVKYVPHAAHCHDWANREPCFRFDHDHPGHPKHGQPVDHQELLQAKPKMKPDQAGNLSLQLGERGVRIKVGPPRYHWDGQVTGVWPDGTVSIRVQHLDPGQGVRDYDRIPVVDAGLEEKPAHSCYLAEAESRQ